MPHRQQIQILSCLMCWRGTGFGALSFTAINNKLVYVQYNLQYVCLNCLQLVLWSWQFVYICCWEYNLNFKKIIKTLLNHLHQHTQHENCEFESCPWQGVLHTTLCDKVCHWFTGAVEVGGFLWILWFPPWCTNKTDLHYITEILLKVALNTITPLWDSCKVSKHIYIFVFYLKYT